MKSAFWARKAHKWIGLIIGVQALLWMISGVYMTVISLDIIHGDHLAHAHQQPLVAPTHLSGEELQRRYPAAPAHATVRDQSTGGVHDTMGTQAARDDVEAFLATLAHAQDAAIRLLRTTILATDPRIGESIKWNAPSFHVEGRHFATMQLRPAPLYRLKLAFSTTSRSQTTRTAANHLQISIDPCSYWRRAQ